MTTNPLFDGQTSQWVFTATALAATTVAAYLVNKRHFAPIPGTSGPQPEFLIGNFRNVLLKCGDLWGVWKDIDRYGPFIVVWFGPMRAIFVNDPDATAEITKNRDAYDTGPMTSDVFDYLIPYGLVGITGDVWKRHRKALTPILGNQRLKFLISKMDNTVQVTIKSIKERIAKTDQPIDVRDDFKDIAMDTMGYLAFGRAFRDIDGNDYSGLPQVDVHLMKESLEVLSKEIGLRLMSLGLYKYIGDSKKVRDAKNVFTNVVNAISKEYEVNLQKMNDSKLDQEEWERFMDRSFIAQVLGSNDGQDFTFDELRGEMITMILAGTDTTSATMGYAIKLLSEHPDVQEKLYEEIITVIGKDAVPRYDQLQETSMPYLDMVIKEIQRLALIVINILRSSKKQVTIKNVVFPKGTPFWMAVASMHRDPKHWKDPLVFLPERWNPDGIANGGPVNPKAYIPFGSGSRICFGMKLASLELKFFLVYLTRTFFFKELPPHLKDKVGEEQVIQNAAIELVNVVALPVLRQ